MSAFLQDWLGWILLAVIVFLCVLISILPEQR